MKECRKFFYKMFYWYRCCIFELKSVFKYWKIISNDLCFLKNEFEFEKCLRYCRTAVLNVYELNENTDQFVMANSI